MLITRPELEHAPGCYGSALAYREGDPQCVSCPFVENCAPLSTERLALLRAEYGIKPPKREVKGSIVTPVGEQLSVPVKVMELIGRIERAGIAMKRDLMRGVNPFNSKPAFLRVACHLLLRIPQGVSRAQLTMAFAHKFEWSPETAMTHTSVAIQTLKAVGAIDDRDGKIILRRE